MIRCIAATLVVVWTSSVFAAVPPPEHPAAVAEWFAGMLRGGDPRELQRAMEPGALFLAWQKPRDILSEHECLSAEPVASATEWLSPDAAVVRIHLRLSGLTRAEWRPRVALPDRWQLQFRRQPDGAWLLRSSLTDEQVLAECMAAEPAPRDADRLLFDTAADPLRALRDYIDQATPSRRAETTLEHALVLSRESGCVPCEAEALQIEALFAAIFRKDPGSPERGQRAVDVARSTNDAETVARALMRLGGLYIAQNRLEEALPPLLESASLAGQSNEPVRSLKAQYMHAHVLGLLNRHFARLQSVEQLLRLSLRYRWREGEEMAAFAKADVLHKLGKLDTAAASWTEAAALAQLNGNPDHAAMAYHQLATVLVQQRRLEQAVAVQQMAVATCPPEAPGRGFMHTELAGYLALSGRLQEAAQSLETALRILRNPDGAYFLANSMLLNQSGRPEEALSNARSAFEWLDKYDPANGEYKVRSLTEAGRSLRALGRRTEAVQAFRSAIDIAETERRHAPGLVESKISVFERQRPAYLQLVELLAEEEGTIPDALRVAERFKARSLLEISTGDGIDLAQELSAGEREREQALETRVIEGNRTLFRTTGSLQQREEQLALLNAARVELEGFRSEMRLRHPRRAERDVEIPASLALPDADAVELVVSEERTIAFIVPAAGSGRSIRAVHLPIARTDLTARSERYLRALGSRSFGYRTEARALYDTLIAPLAPYLPGDGPVCIVPDGPLWSLPFQTLIAPDGRHLAEQRAITVTPSLALLHIARPQRGGQATLLAFGNPRVGGTAHETVRAAAYDIPMSSLPDAETEVRTISALYDVGTTHVRDDATETAFKRESSKYRILHLATHGFVASGAPLYSGLVFSSDGENDGILEVREVAEMKLDADLAVLSACDTAAGEISDGEGVVGLSWGFLAAGCPTTIVSQWKAESAATARLMVELHRQLRRQETPAEALRRAQMSLMRSEAYWHPYYWAPFIVVGRNTVVGN